MSLTDMEKLLEEKLQTIDEVQSQQFFSRLLTSCDWYTLRKLIPVAKLKVILSDEVLNRLFPKDLKNKYIYARKLNLKLDFVNDVPAHFGQIRASSIFHRIDSWRNILSNKICALSRLEAKDLIDVVFIAMNYQFDWETIINEAKEKDLWVDPIEICRIIDQLPANLLTTIKWIENVNIDDLKKQITVVHNDIFKGSFNSLATSGKGPQK